MTRYPWWVWLLLWLLVVVALFAMGEAVAALLHLVFYPHDSWTQGSPWWKAGW